MSFRNNARCTQAGKEGHARPGWTTSRRGQDSPWKSQPEWQRTGINGESTSVVWPTLGSRTAKEQNRCRSNFCDKCSWFSGGQEEFPLHRLVLVLPSHVALHKHWVHRKGAAAAMAPHVMGSSGQMGVYTWVGNGHYMLAVLHRRSAMLWCSSYWTFFSTITAVTC